MLLLKRSTIHEAAVLLDIQKEAFQEDLITYEDYETNPVNEPIERLIKKIQLFIHYTIWIDGEIAGGADVRDNGDGKYRLNRVFLSKQYQNKGFGTELINLIEAQFPLAKEWALDTPYLNTRNHHFYEKLGYKRQGQHQVNHKLILIDYVKKMGI